MPPLGFAPLRKGPLGLLQAQVEVLTAANETERRERQALNAALHRKQEELGAITAALQAKQAELDEAQARAISTCAHAHEAKHARMHSVSALRPRRGRWAAEMRTALSPDSVCRLTPTWLHG